MEAEKFQIHLMTKKEGLIQSYKSNEIPNVGNNIKLKDFRIFHVKELLPYIGNMFILFGEILKNQKEEDKK